jgi:crotonobetainyl-CoA:carnitine CoA-transferase CaiB-like acyl-CoA transferase
LTGYRVLDLCDDKGVLCTKILADLGADVMIIEPPGGAVTRSRGPFYHDRAQPESSLFFWYFHANKRSLTLHLETPDGQALCQTLVKTADVLVETFPPGYLDRLGPGYTDLRVFHPGLVMTSITGFGSTGAYCHYKAPDLVGLAMGGLMYLCGEPEGAPVPPGGQQGDHLAALNGVAGPLIALWHRELTGVGQHVDGSMQAAVANTLETTHQTYDFNRNIRSRFGHKREGAAYIVPCQDGYVALICASKLGWPQLVQWMQDEGGGESVSDTRLVDDIYRFEHDADFTEQEWTALCGAMGHPSWAHEGRFSTLRGRLQHVDDLDRLLATWTTQHPPEEVIHRLQAVGVAAGVVQNARDLLEHDPQLRQRGHYHLLNHSVTGPTLYMGPAFTLSATPACLRPAPCLGQHNAYVYGQLLGISAADIAQYTQGKVFY